MTTEEVANALIDWAHQHVPDLADEPTQDPEPKWPLPGVAVGVTRVALEPMARLQQKREKVRTCSLTLFCEHEPADSAGPWLYGAVDVLMDELMTDKTLGRRVHSASPDVAASFEPPFVQLGDDEAIARQATLVLTVREPA